MLFSTQNFEVHPKLKPNHFVQDYIIFNDQQLTKSRRRRMLDVKFLDTFMTYPNTKVPLEASKKVVLEVNAEKTKYVFMSRHQNEDKS
jgi:hypothetical protein